MNVCDWCELPIEATERPIRLATSQAPWTAQRAYGAARVIAAAAFSASAALGVAGGRPEIVLWFHPVCWDKFQALLKGE